MIGTSIEDQPKVKIRHSNTANLLREMGPFLDCNESYVFIDYLFSAPTVMGCRTFPTGDRIYVLQWKRGVLTTGPPGKSVDPPFSVILKNCMSPHILSVLS